MEELFWWKRNTSGIRATATLRHRGLSDDSQEPNLVLLRDNVHKQIFVDQDDINTSEGPACLWTVLSAFTSLEGSRRPVQRRL